MNLATELRDLNTPEAAPDLSRAILARIERLEATDAIATPDDARSTSRDWTTWLAPAGVAVGVMLILFSGVIASPLLGRVMAIAVPTIPGAALGPAALLAGLALYFSGLWIPTAGRPDVRT